MSKEKFKYGEYEVEASFGGLCSSGVYKWDFNIYENGELLTSLRDYHSEHSSEIKAFEEWW
ncbi:hypothetical protein D7X33_32010, partial [Butyricicoccus sp. 1XD8-22]